MRRFAILAASSALAMASAAQAAVLYSAGIQGLTGGPGVGNVTAIIGPITGGPNFNAGFGDDYTSLGGTTGTITMTKFIFAGGVSVANGALGFEFYNADGSDAAAGFSVQLPSAGAHIWTITLGSPTVIPASGFVVMQPVVDGVFSGVPGSTGSWGQGDVVDVGSNDLTITANVDDTDVLTTGPFINNANPQLLSFEIQGNPVPEASSVALVAPAALLVGRRRRSR